MLYVHFNWINLLHLKSENQKQFIGYNHFVSADKFIFQFILQKKLIHKVKCFVHKQNILIRSLITDLKKKFLNYHNISYKYIQSVK